MKKGLLSIVFCLSAFFLFAQSKTAPKNGSSPKLVVGIMIDQMRWDYLYRFKPLFKANGGFNKMMGEGFSCDNTLIPYAPTVTACGHASVYTGSVPAINGITGNSWYDNQLLRSVYCSEDKSVRTVGSNTDAGQMSPKNMLTTTICDELRLASNFKSKVIGIAIKDRGSILPAGHAANGAYWYDSKTGNFISSSYYMQELPNWVNQFNKRSLVDSLYTLGWKSSLTKEAYLNYATEDHKSYEGKPFGKDALGFPYDLSSFIGKDYSKISSTPHGNTLTVEMAMAAIKAEQLGKGAATDFLALSFSSPDYIGHSFGPNSWEQVDDYVRLDEALGKLLAFLDAQVGKNQYSIFLTADHAVAHIPGFMKENHLPAGHFDDVTARNELNALFLNKYGVANIVNNMTNFQVSLNHKKMDSAKLDIQFISQIVINHLLTKDAIANAFETRKILQTSIPKTQREMFVNGYYPNRAGDIQFVLKPGYMEGGNTGTTHGLWSPYDAHIPLLFYGWGIKKGMSKKEYYMTDIAPTIAALLNIQMPSGSIGKPIDEVLK